MTEAAKNTAHRIFALFSMATLIALPVVAHSYYAGRPGVQLALTIVSAVLSALGLKVVRPLIDLGLGDVGTELHTQLGTLGTVLVGVLTAIRGAYPNNHAVGLAIDIAIPLLGWLGIIVVQTDPIEEPTARTKQSGFVTIPTILVLAAIGFAIAVLNSGCVPTAYVNALKVKGTASETLLTAYQAWRTYDGVQQDSIIAGNSDRATALKQLTVWRDGTQRKVDDAFVAARDALTAYSQALGAADAVKRSDWSDAIAKVASAVSELLSALESAGVQLPKTATARRQMLATKHLPLTRLVLATGDFIDHLCADPRFEYSPSPRYDDALLSSIHCGDEKDLFFKFNPPEVRR